MTPAEPSLDRHPCQRAAADRCPEPSRRRRLMPTAVGSRPSRAAAHRRRLPPTGPPAAEPPPSAADGPASEPLPSARRAAAEPRTADCLQAAGRRRPPTRRLVGRPVAPVRGLAPGCPAATDWMALIMFTSKQAICQSIPRAIARDCVDDLVAHVVGDPEECVAAVWHMEVISQQFAQATMLQLNTDKSVRFASTAAVRRAAAERPRFRAVPPPSGRRAAADHRPLLPTLAKPVGETPPGPTSPRRAAADRGRRRGRLCSSEGRIGLDWASRRDRSRVTY